MAVHTNPPSTGILDESDAKIRPDLKRRLGKALLDIVDASDSVAWRGYMRGIGIKAAFRQRNTTLRPKSDTRFPHFAAIRQPARSEG